MYQHPSIKMDIGLIDFNGHTVHVSAMRVTSVNPQKEIC